MNRFRLPLSIGAAALAALAGSPSAVAAPSGADRAGATVTIAVRMTEMKFALSRSSVRRGTTVVFRLRNNGTVPHNMRIRNASRSVTSRLIQPGATGTLRATFRTAGRFQYWCTVPGHRVAGMRGIFRVT